MYSVLYIDFLLTNIDTTQIRARSAKVPVRKFTIDGSNRPVRPRSCSARARSDPINIDLNELMNVIEEEGIELTLYRILYEHR